MNDRGGFAGRGPAGNTLPRDFAHRIEDRDVRDIICFVDPARAVQPPHLIIVKPLHIDLVEGKDWDIAATAIPESCRLSR